MNRIIVISFVFCIFFLQSCKLKDNQSTIKPNSIVDVTLPPYNCDNTGQKDCSDAILKAYSDVINSANLNFKIESYDSSNQFDLTNQTYKSIISKILYFPAGKYKITKPIGYLGNNLKTDSASFENYQITLKGDGEDKTNLFLADNARGYNNNNNFIGVVEFSGVCSQKCSLLNNIEGLTIDVGKGNPSAIGVNYIAGNTGVIRKVKIISSDPDNSGGIGLNMDSFKCKSYIKELTVEGFDTGIRTNCNSMFSVFENVELFNQKNEGLIIHDSKLSIRGLYSKNIVPAVRVIGKRAHVVMIDSELYGGDNSCSAINVEGSVFFGRNINSNGYGRIYTSLHQIINKKFIAEYSSHSRQVLYEDALVSTLNMLIEEVPVLENEEYENDNWVCVNDFGAIPDITKDVGNAIQKAIDSGAQKLWFKPGRYFINQGVQLKSSLCHMDFSNVNIMVGEKLRSRSEDGVFKIVGENDTPLLLEGLNIGESIDSNSFWFNHASKRSVVIKDLYSSVGSVYLNTIEGGKVFIENALCYCDSIDNNGFVFNNQKVWIRHLSLKKYTSPQVINNGSDLWILGLNSFGNGVMIETINNGRTEILGGFMNLGKNILTDSNEPIIYVENSQMSFAGANRMQSPKSIGYKGIIEERQGDKVQFLSERVLPNISNCDFSLPLYLSKK